MDEREPAADTAPAFAELTALSNFSFLRGASHPEELVERAAALGYRALALTDIASLAGLVRAHEAAQRTGVHLIAGARLQLADGPELTVLVRDRTGYAALCRLITTARGAADKGEHHLTRADLEAVPEAERAGWHVLLHLWPESDTADPDDAAAWLRAWAAPGQGHLAVALLRTPGDPAQIARARQLAQAHDLPVTACGDVHMHARGRRALQDVLTALHHRCTVAQAAGELFPNGERCLRPRADLATLYPAAWLCHAVAIADDCRFSLDELEYHYPTDPLPPGRTATEYLRDESLRGARKRWPDGIPEAVQAQIERELGIIAELGYEPYFLTVYDIVRFARSRGILCQGRGSAANSAVCYALGITAVDPSRSSMLFERFISAERGEPPDIDVDFEHERREEVIQYIYRRYGRNRAALACTVIRYRRRSALRDVGRALGLSRARLDALTANLAWWDEGIPPERLREVGLEPDGALARQWQALTAELVGFPRHLSQHTGGFVIAAGRLDELVPIENAAMPERSVIQWDKDDLDAAGLLKIDVLSLGMLSCVRRALELMHRHRGRDWGLADIPAEDPAVYAMLQKADSLGVFQIESRAQMSMLPRLKPKNFYDLVIEIAIVRPGPIQGEMVHPYLKRRAHPERVRFPNAEIERVLGRTLGVPIFQEQVIELAMVAAGFSAGEADGLRRSIGAWRRRGDLGRWRERLLEGMRERGYSAEFAERLYRQILGFGEYGFPESHSASFALITWVSAWLKCFEPAIFACALLNSQPMGFYGPAQIVADARRHGVEVRPVDVNHSQPECSLEAAGDSPDTPDAPDVPDAPLALRLGFNRVQGLRREVAERIHAARAEGPFSDVPELVARARLSRAEAGRLARAGALAGLAGNRHQARWAADAVEAPLPLFEGLPQHAEPADAPHEPREPNEPGQAGDNARTPLLPVPDAVDDLIQDYATTGLTLGPHPLALLRPQLERRRLPDSATLSARRRPGPARYAGLVITRQRPGSANGTVFLTLEDEHGTLNVIVWPDRVERFRAEVLHGQLLEIDGEWQWADDVGHLVARRLTDRSTWLGDLVTRSRDFG
ncbi:error-prone DNA polymerase [Thioalkalivibrio sp. ALE23]|uniref:error-prone DNA polymerase n=1 Tax=Thioalkalivibrio sp. ALE23 TaxID=1265495 RepID=UPI000361D8DB|nr:error-prone DNA polymerase [Thioalkalivibrio sp. ALE23]